MRSATVHWRTARTRSRHHTWCALQKTVCVMSAARAQISFLNAAYNAVCCEEVACVLSAGFWRHDCAMKTCKQAASEGGHGAEQNAANWQQASTFFRQFDGAMAAPAALRVPAVLSTLAAVPLPGICGASWVPYDACTPEGPGPSLYAPLPPAREPMSDGAPAGDSDAFTFPRLSVEERHHLRAACRREADSYCTAWNQSLRPAQVTVRCHIQPCAMHVRRATKRHRSWRSPALLAAHLAALRILMGGISTKAAFVMNNGDMRPQRIHDCGRCR